MSVLNASAEVVDLPLDEMQAVARAFLALAEVCAPLTPGQRVRVAQFTAKLLLENVQEGQIVAKAVGQFLRQGSEEAAS